MVDKVFAAMKAFIVNSGKVLIIKEAEYDDGQNEDKWSLVGGRVDPGEEHLESLRREIREEVGLEVDIGSPVTTGEWRHKVRGKRWQIIATFFECEAKNTDVHLGEEHSDYRWIEPKDHKNFNLIGNLFDKFEDYLAFREKAKPVINAGKAAIINENGKILLIKRRDDETHLENLWDVPGGKFDYKEEPLDGLEREVKEEAGIDIEIIEPVTTWSYMHENGVQRTGATYLCRPESEKIELGNEHSDGRWVSREELEELPMHEGLKEGVIRASEKMTEF